MQFPREILAEIRARIPIEDLAGEYTRLRKRGKNFVGLCPLPGHQEKTPSFTVTVLFSELFS